MERRAKSRRAHSSNEVADSYELTAAFLGAGAILKLPGLTRRVLRLDPAKKADGADPNLRAPRPPRAVDISELDEQLAVLARLLSYPTAKTFTAVLTFGDGEVAVALLQLLSATVRLPVTISEAGHGRSISQTAGELPPGRAVSDSVCSLVSALVLGLLGHASGPARLSFGLKVLRMQTLQALARQLAEATNLPMVTNTQLKATEDVLTLAVNALHCVGEFATTINVSVFHEFVAALRDSCFLEHLSQTMMQRLEAAPLGTALLNMWAGSLAARYSQLGWLGMEEDGGTSPAFAYIATVLGGPCAVYAAMSVGLKTLCAADGGPSYGMPPEVWEVLPVIAECPGSAIGGPGQPREIAPAALRALVLASLLGVRAGRLGRRAVVALLLRVCRLAVSSIAAAAAPSLAAAVAGGERGGGGGGAVAPTSASPPVGNTPSAAADGEVRQGTPIELRAGAASWSLGVVALRQIRRLSEAHAAEWQALQVEWWRLAVPLLRATDIGQSHTIAGQLIAVPLLDAAVEAPGAPQPLVPDPVPEEVSTALEAGLLPALERLVRRGCVDPTGEGTEARLLDSLLVHLPNGDRSSWLSWAPLLLYGEPRQAAALVVSVGKALRRASDTAPNPSLARFVVLFLHYALRHALSCEDTDHGGGEGDAGSCVVRLSSAPAGLQALLPLALCLWLPPLARMAVKIGVDRSDMLRLLVTSIFVLAATASLGSEGEGSRGAPVSVPGPCDGAVVGSRSASGTGCEGGSSGSSVDSTSTSGDRAVWCRLLLEEMDPVAVMGAALRRDCTTEGLAPAFAVLAATFPEFVQSATLAAVTESPEMFRCDAEGRLPPAAEDRLPWSPVRLRVLAAQFNEETYGHRLCVSLAAQVEVWATGRADNMKTGEPQALVIARGMGQKMLEVMMPAARFLAAVPASAFSPPLASCGSPACARLDADSELNVKLQQCGRCGGVAYCCRGCQTAHWRAGHKAQCRPRENKGSAKPGGGS